MNKKSITSIIILVVIAIVIIIAMQSGHGVETQQPSTPAPAESTGATQPDPMPQLSSNDEGWYDLSDGTMIEYDSDSRFSFTYNSNLHIRGNADQLLTIAGFHVDGLAEPELLIRQQPENLSIEGHYNIFDSEVTEWTEPLNGEKAFIHTSNPVPELVVHHKGYAYFFRNINRWKEAGILDTFTFK